MDIMWRPEIYRRRGRLPLVNGAQLNAIYGTLWKNKPDKN
jgi:hypothetical protein